MPDVVTGLDFLIEVETGAEWDVVGGGRDATLRRQTTMVDASHKGEFGWGNFLPTVLEWSIDHEGVLFEGDAGWDALHDAMENRNKVNVRVKYPSGATATGEAFVENMDERGPLADVATGSVSLRGAGPLVREDASA